MLKLSFHGGAGTVTGSRHLLTVDGERVLVDAGLFQGLKALRLLNWRPPSFDVRSVGHLILTHAHIDHAGYLPRLIQDGYQGPVYATPATRELAELLLMDSAKIQEEDAERANRRGYSKHAPALPLYTSADAAEALTHFRTVDYDEWLELSPAVRFRFRNAGHILGSAFVEVHARGAGTEASLVFSGDVGRYGMPLHVDPTPPPASDVLVVESTYGDRSHNGVPLKDQVRIPFRKAFDQRGTVLIPAFAVGRAQLLTVILSELMRSGDLPEVPVHVDSPMAVDATEIYSHHLRDNTLDGDLIRGGQSVICPPFVRFHRSVEESKALNNLPGPRIIISASGMLTAGRVLHHVSRLLPERKNLVVLAGFQAAGTRGRSLLEGARTLKIHGEEVPVRAELLALHGLSAHGDREELLRWSLEGGRPRVAFVTHGEPEAAQSLALRLEHGGIEAIVPRLDEEFDLAAWVR